MSLIKIAHWGALDHAPGVKVLQLSIMVYIMMCVCTIRAVMSAFTCMSMVSNSTSDSECYLAAHVRIHI